MMSHVVQAFEATYKREFGFILEDRSIMVDDVRVRAMGKVYFFPYCVTRNNFKKRN